MSETNSNRYEKGVSRGKPLVFYVDGREVQGYHGETIAAAMIAAGLRESHITHEMGQGRGYYCGMGLCWECIMVVDGLRSVRICRTLVNLNMRVETQSDG